MTSGRLLLVVDVGTGSGRSLIFSGAGEQVAVAQREWTHPEDPAFEGALDFDLTVTGFDTPSLDLLIGGPGEDTDSVSETIDFIKSVDPDRAGAATGVRLYPGTPLARQNSSICSASKGDTRSAK